MRTRMSERGGAVMVRRLVCVGCGAPAILFSHPALCCLPSETVTSELIATQEGV